MARAKRAATEAKSYKEVDDGDHDDGWDSSDDDQKKTAAAAGTKRRAPKAAERGDQHAAPARKRQHTLAANVDLHDLSLLDVILKHSNAIDKAVEEWIERYKDNRAAAAAELMTLLVQVAGCDQEVTEDEVEGGEVDRLASRLCEAVEDEGGVEVLRSARSGRGFAGHYCIFWDRLLRGLAAADLLYDDFELNDKLVRLVTALNISTVRSFRHAATLTASQLVSSWIAVSAGLTKSRELAKFQLDAEEKKKSKGGAGMNPAAAALRRTLDRCHARVEDLRNFRSVTFTGVFSHRFRDVDDGIRAIVIESIGRWIAELPTEFLADTYLKYLGWALSDKSPLVRGKAVAAISALYEDSENVPRLHEFAARFTTRFTELMSDIDEGVAAAALRLLAQLVQHGVLKHEAVSDVFAVLSQENAALRRAAAGLAVQLLEEHGRAAVSKAADALQATADAAAGRSKSAKGKAGSKGKAAAGQSAAAAAAAGMLQDPQQLQLAGLLAVMAGMSPQAGNVAAAEQSSQSAAGPGGVLPTLSLLRVVDLVDALWEHMPQVLGDVGALADCLADEGAGELRGRQGNANLAVLLAGSVYRSVHPPATAAGRKGRGRAAPAGAAAAAGGIDAEAQQDVTVALSQKLPVLLTQFQAEAAVAAPLLAIPPFLRLEQFLLSKQEEGYRALLQQADGLLQRHSHLPLVNEAAAVLVHASKNGPAALQEIGRQVLHSCCAASAAKLASAAAAVGKLRAAELAEGVADLATSPGEAPDALLSLLACLQRVRVLVTAGADELSRDKQVAKACQTLLQQSLAGRELGPEIMQLLLHTTNTSLLWQQRSAQHSAAAVPAFVQSRTNFMRVLEALLDSGAAEQLVRPEQLLQAGGGADVAAGYGGLGGLGLAGNEIPADLADQVAAGIPTLQDLAGRLLLDHVFLAGSVTSLAGNAAAAEDGAGSSEAAAALAAAATRLLPSMTLLNKLWRYCLSVLDREGPDEEALAAAEDDADDDDEDADEDLGGAADIDGWDVEGAASRRAARRAARRELLMAAALRLALLRRSAVQGLVALVGFRAVPEPGFSWLLARLATLLEGRQPAIAATVRVMLQQLKASAPEAAPQHFLAALKMLYEEAAMQEEAGAEEQPGDSLQHCAAVSHRIASLYSGHNLSQGPLRGMFTFGIAWALEEPAARAAFLPTCLGPFAAKLAAAEAGQVAGQLQQRLPAAEAALQGGEDEEAVEDLKDFLKALQDRAAGKKATRGVLKTAGRAAGGEASDEEDADAAAEDDTAGAAARKQGGKKKAARRGRGIRFAADVGVQPDEEKEGAAAAAAGSRGRAGAAGAGRKRAAAAGAAAGSSKRTRRQQQQDAADEWDDTPAGLPEQQGSDSSGGWHTKRSSGASPAKQQRGGARGRQQQKGASPRAAAAAAAAVPALDAAAALEEEEDAIEEYEQAAVPVPRATARQRAAGGARQAAAAPARSPRADLRLIDRDAGPLNTQSQSQSQGRPRQGKAAAAAAAAGTAAMAAGRGRRGAAAVPAVAEEEQLQEEEEEEQQQYDEDEEMGDAEAAADLAADTDEEAEEDEQQQHDDDDDAEEDEEEEEEQPQLYAGSEEEDAYDNDDNVDDEQQQQPEASQFSEPLQSLNLVMEDLEDEEDDAEGGLAVDEPPPTRRQGRRRR
uniref:SCD domain-containing protein n=1 Tax=Tetradesmus obliquus TaxID=3088 RepID=A0A383WKN0_TETOB|eukprot:jgi/Sobl393_1/11176/SZX78020.1